jgi:DNA repair protein RadC
MPTREDAHVEEVRHYQLRELVCTYRPARNVDGRIVRASSLPLTDAGIAARVLSPLMADHTVEMFGVVCLSTRHRCLAWHVVSRGTRDSTPISYPDVFVPACVTPGTVGLILVHNHPSGDPTPSSDDIGLTARLRAASEILDLRLLDHLILGVDARYFSFRESGLLGGTPSAAVRSTTVRAVRVDGHASHTTRTPLAAPNK